VTLELELAARLSGTVVVVGVGNPLRGDDGAGCLVARRLAGAAGVSVLETEEVPESFVGDIAAAGPDTVVLVDAVDLGARPGAMALLERDQVALYSPTTHRLPLSLVMDVVHRRTCADVFLIGIQPADVAFGAAVSPEVSATVEVVAGLLSRCGGWADQRPGKPRGEPAAGEGTA
jgi:hydrogenase 3 maturation protease